MLMRGTSDDQCNVIPIRPTVRGSDGVKAAFEPSTTLDGFRGVSEGARAVRYQRRTERYFGVDSAGVDGGLPRPYTGESNGDAGGSGRVTLNPTPEVLARYQEAGLILARSLGLIILRVVQRPVAFGISKFRVFPSQVPRGFTIFIF